MKRLIILTYVILLALVAAAQEGKPDTESETKPMKEDQLRCERFIKSNLKELKSKLQDNCDLNKPFSTSLSVNLGEEHYLYCCHKKK